MAIVIDRETKQIRYSVDAALYPDHMVLKSKAVDLDVEAIEAIPQQYRKIAGKSVIEMTLAERNAVDAASANTIRNERANAVESGDLMSVVDSLISVINQRLPQDQRITRAEVVNAIRGAS